ncbi:thermonuclease family protein [Alcaligenaceae bacterium]|nr:thermonuclease family protein [Alcaligenaceae bacterium]
MANKWSRLLVLASAAGLAGAASLTALKPTANATTGSQITSGGYTLTGRVVRVADGDTFTLLVDGKQQKVRMASIDAPETTKGSKQPGQAHAQAAKDALAALIAGKTLSINCFERDRYDRNVCDVPLGNGVTANQKQVAAGLAWANMEGRGKFMRDPKIPPLERQAKDAKKGIWSQPGAVSPWAWRYQCWKQQQC